MRYVPRWQAAKSERTVPKFGTPDPVEMPDQASRALRRGAAKSRKARNLIGKKRPVSFVYTAGRFMPIKLRAFLDFAAPRLRARLA